MKFGPAGAMARWNFTPRTWRRLRGFALHFLVSYEQKEEAASYVKNVVPFYALLCSATTAANGASLTPLDHIIFRRAG